MLWQIHLGDYGPGDLARALQETWESPWTGLIIFSPLCFLALYDQNLLLEHATVMFPFNFPS